MREEAIDVIMKLIDKKFGLLIIKVAFTITGDDHLVEDIKQEVLMRCVPRYADLDKMPREDLKSYLCAITKNVAINYMRKREQEEVKNERYYEQYLSVDSIDFSAFNDQYGFGLEVTTLLDQLDSLDKDIICMKYGLGFTNEEVGIAIGKTEDYVKKRMYRSKIKLQNILIDESGAEGDEE